MSKPPILPLKAVIFPRTSAPDLVIWNTVVLLALTVQESSSSSQPNDELLPPVLVTRAEIWSRVREALDAVGLDVPLDRATSALSGGQVRRAEIARALIHRPQLMLLDEPTVGLDVKSRAEVLALTRRLIADQGVSALWATHILDEIQPSDGLVILHRGRVLFDGTAATAAPDGDLTRAFLDLTGVQA